MQVTVRANVSCEVQQHAVYSLLIEQALGDGIWSLTALMEGENVMYSPLQIEIRPGVSAKYSRGEIACLDLGTTKLYLHDGLVLVLFLYSMWGVSLKGLVHALTCSHVLCFHDL